jgi:muramoyltetrapeptide carboxypeptidase
MQLCSPPPPLQPGDRLRVISPSGALREPKALEDGIAIWRARGYQVELSPGYDGRWGYLAGTDADRRGQWRSALLDPDCKGILCARGGWGGARLLESWDWAGLDPLDPRLNKWLIGFSDITSLLMALGQRGISGVHGPLLLTLADEPGWSKDRLFDWVEGRAKLPVLQGEGWAPGQTQGLLLPINLTVATHLLGSPYEPDWGNVVLAIEDVGEAPYRIDRMLTHWRLAGIFQQVRGIALGRFSLCDPDEGMPSLSLEQVLRDRLGDLNLPVVANLPFGHGGDNAALPVGVEVTLDGDRGTLEILTA